MKSDISRDTFNPTKHFSRVVLQQGRVTLDADWNEQASIQLHLLRTMAVDLFGDHCGPNACPGFEVISDAKRIDDTATRLPRPLPKSERERLGLYLSNAGKVIGPGRYYVDGLLCENEGFVPASDQPDLPAGTDDAKAFVGPLAPGSLIYLDVWERGITALEDDSMREVALGGPDTAARTKVVWQVRTKSPKDDALWPGPTDPTKITNGPEFDKEWPALRKRLQGPSRGLLQVQVPPAAKDADACRISPDSRYRGAENQLYRIEIHQGGVAGVATFKWSRDNGSVVAAWKAGPDGALEFEGVRDPAHSFAAGHWIELTSRVHELTHQPGEFVQIAKVEAGMVTLADKRSTASGTSGIARRWDHQHTKNAPAAQDQAVRLTEGIWIDLEEGIQVFFAAASEKDNPHIYRTGDYWLVPARVETGDVEWPQDEDAKGKKAPRAMPPCGTEHHFGPLALVKAGGALLDLRHTFYPVPFHALPGS